MRWLFIRYFVFAVLGWFATASFAAEQLRNLGAAPAIGAKRIALVIGNAAYPGVGALKNPANDARDVAAKLKRLGFDVIVRTDVRQKEMLRSLTEFGDKIQAGTEALFFYAGHGMQVRGRNYLIPIDAEIRNESSVSSEAVDVDQLLDKLAPARLSLVILDACRNNPFERRFRGGGQGLAQINAPTGTLIAYATAPGKVAADGEGRNGLYTAELLSAMDVPGIKIEDVFKRVRGNVVKKSGEAQTPWESSSLTGDFYFVPGGTASTIGTTGMGAGSPSSPSADEALWRAVESSDSVEDYEAYLKQYPEGNFAALALSRKQRIQALQEKRRREPEIWSAAEIKNSEKDYLAYLDLYPEGRHAEAAASRIKKLQAERLAAIEQQQMSRLCFFRKARLASSSVAASVDVDGKRVGLLNSGEAFCVKHPAGSYSISIYPSHGAPQDRPLQVAAESGKTTYVELDTPWGIWATRLSGEKEAEQEISTLRQR